MVQNDAHDIPEPSAEKKSILRDTVVEHIYGLITRGEFSYDSRLPAERLLAARFSVSRHVIREALRILEQQQIVYTRLGSGTYVVNPTQGAAGPNQTDGEADGQAAGRAAREADRAGLMEIFEFRRRLEPRIAFLAAMHATKEDHALLRRSLAASEKAIAAQNIEKWHEEDRRFHAALATMTGNSLYMKTGPLLHQAMVTFREGVGQSLSSQMAPAMRAHEEIVRAVISGKAKEAAAFMEQHIILAVRNAFRAIG